MTFAFSFASSRAAGVLNAFAADGVSDPCAVCGQITPCWVVGCTRSGCAAEGLVLPGSATAFCGTDGVLTQSPRTRISVEANEIEMWLVGMWLLPAIVARLVLPCRASGARSIRPTDSESGGWVRNTGERPRSGPSKECVNGAGQRIQRARARDDAGRTL